MVGERSGDGALGEGPSGLVWSPWSGAYEITSPTWALAHTSQFAPIGWRYAAHGSGVAVPCGQ